MRRSDRSRTADGEICQIGGREKEQHRGGEPARERSKVRGSAEAKRSRMASVCHPELSHAASLLVHSRERLFGWFATQTG
jgi:hypothetical protein